MVAAFGLGLLTLGGGALVLLDRRDHEAGPREEQVYDDFGFAVVSAERAGGRIAVGLQVSNHARRVPFRMDNFRVRLVDAAGQEYEERAELARKPRAQIEAGESLVETHVFDVPGTAQGVVLEVSFGSIPDALDRLFLGRRTWRLP